jgi:hypothetical protein
MKDRSDFDPAIKYGREQKLFVKREYLTLLGKETRFTENELQNDLKIIYTSIAG